MGLGKQTQAFTGKSPFAVEGLIFEREVVAESARLGGISCECG
jgi:hypothetical protein